MKRVQLENFHQTPDGESMVLRFGLPLLATKLLNSQFLASNCDGRDPLAESTAEQLPKWTWPVASKVAPNLLGIRWEINGKVIESNKADSIYSRERLR